MSGRHRTASSYGHKIKMLSPGIWRISWVMDRYIAGNRQRHPTGYQRITDRDGAERFARKWDIAMPADTQ